ncbi:putative membrane protein [Rhizobium leguminosarum]|uniref:Membrane protein n=1 Tax=Rhizobium leguminosarum TaxID=384 RepID=A0AAE2SWI7_RHILE|nr:MULTISPECIES: putative phage abortive infection protein [Rhizobium]MBB4289499.1 putative membrane protein [Rhizobium leguminosarum]MBB4294405.1 putative membrane protein [Rhizobium leguminosarum]MBB4305801.1 putative membrane protein [Rhizobium leguminosarum]MBB4418622.1 putative membrane protein [Rhizobium leguminosarum]MBB4433466.1 putative membrane protein [Rhizobium esperanzae]
MRFGLWFIAMAVIAIGAYILHDQMANFRYEYYAAVAILMAAVSGSFWASVAVDRIVQPKSGDSRHIFTFLLVVAFLMIGAATVVGVHTEWEDKNLGTLGDFLGGTLNPILTFLSFIALLLTIVLQQREVHSARGEANSLKTERFKDRMRAEKQQFENTFFQMLNYHNSIVNSIDIWKGQTKETLRGRECFKFYFDVMKAEYDRVEMIDARQRVLHAYHSKVWETFQKDLAHYYRFLYNLVRFVDQNKVVSKTKYIRIMRAQLSDFEMSMLFYNGLTDNGTRFKEYVEYFTLFDNLPDNALLSSAHRSFYAESAFDEAARKQPLSFQDVNHEVAEAEDVTNPE